MARRSGDLLPPSPPCEEANAGKHETRQSSTNGRTGNCGPGSGNLAVSGFCCRLQYAVWPAPGSEDTELGVLMELEVGHGEILVVHRPGCSDCAPKRRPTSSRGQSFSETGTLTFPESPCGVRLYRHLPFPQSSSASRRSVGAAGFLNFSQSGTAAGHVARADPVGHELRQFSGLT